MAPPQKGTISIQSRLDQAAQLIQRLERISVDSVWAHRSSGFRGSLLKWMDTAETRQKNGIPLAKNEIDHYALLMNTGLEMLSHAAHEKIRNRGTHLNSEPKKAMK